MFRTTIMLPMALRGRLEKEAKDQNLSFGELVRRALQKYLLLKNVTEAAEPFFSSKTVFGDKGPADGARLHDNYLIRLSPHGKKP